MLKKMVLATSLLSTSMFAEQALHETHKVNPNKEMTQEWKEKLYNDTQQKVYKGEELYTIGMPVGGIGAGQLYVRGDGTLANWWISNNAYNTGYGINHLLNFDTEMGPWEVCYQTFKPRSYIEQGVDLIVEQDGKTFKKELSEKGFKNIEFIGEYPVAEVKYQDAALPVTIDAEFFSPFIPLNARDSANPMTVLRYKVTNNSGKGATVTLNSRMQNPVALELRKKLNASSLNSIVDQGGNTSLFMEVSMPKASTTKPVLFDSLDDFAKWKVSGQAFGQPASGKVGRQAKIDGQKGKFANSFHGDDKATGEMLSKSFTIDKDFIVFRIGGGAHKNTALQLIVDGKVAKTESGSNSEKLEAKSWDVSKLKGQTAQLKIVDNHSGSWGHVLVDEIEFSDNPAPFPFNEKHPYYGNVAMTVLGGGEGTVGGNKGIAKLGEKLTGSVAKTIELAAGETQEVTFVLSWFFPNRRTNIGGGGSLSWSQPISDFGGDENWSHVRQLV